MEVQRICDKWGIKRRGFELLKHLANTDNISMIKWLEERWAFSNTFKPFYKGSSYHQDAYLLKRAAGGLDEQVLAKYMLFEKRDYAEFMNHFLDYGRINKICIQEVQFETIQQACLAYKAPYEKVVALAEYTGLPQRELVVAYSIWGTKIDNFFSRLQQAQSTSTTSVRPPIQYQQPQVQSNQNHANNKRTVSNSPNAKGTAGNKAVQPSEQSRKIRYEGSTYNDLFELSAVLKLNATILNEDLRNGLPLERAVKKQLEARKTSKVTHNSMTVDGKYYPNLKSVCLDYDLNPQEVSTYRSKHNCTPYEAVMVCIEKKYGKRE